MTSPKTIQYKNFTIHQFDCLDSTNDLAKNLANNWQIFDREIIIANQQNKGRGRMNRQWVSPQGNLYFSLVLQPKIAIEKIPQMSMVAIAILNLAIQKIAKNFQLKIENKWPNDLLINNKKVAGILLESINYNNNCEYLIIGIGVNINSFPPELSNIADKLQNYFPTITAEEMLNKFLDEFEILYHNWQDFGFKNIRQLWRQNAYNLNQEITVKPNNNETHGIFKDIDDEGNLLLEINQKIHKFNCGDVLFNN
jgi:BirA family biotin operon repressor/biotin-[acetyl-CoA-carboxylase] ligase